MSYEIHWHEGLFLLPQHFQGLQRSLHREIEAERRNRGPYSFGLIDLDIAPEELENNLLRVRRLHAIMPSGAEVRFPGTADIGTLDLTDLATAGTGVVVIYLAVPLWHENRANSLQPGSLGAKVRYQIKEQNLNDENEGRNAKPLLVRQLNARLLVDGDDRSDFEVFPLLRLVPTASEHLSRFRLDTKFAGPCVGVTASRRLATLLRDVVGNVENARLELTALLESRFSGTSFSYDTFAKNLRLLVVARAAARLRPLLEAPGVPPFAWYLELAGLQAELATGHPDPGLSVVPAYDAENPLEVFEVLSSQLRKLLVVNGAPTVVKIDFVRNGDHVAADLSSVKLDRVNDWFLCIVGGVDPKLVTNLVANPNQFKVTLPREIKLALSGVELLWETTPPPLGFPRGSLVFRLSRKWPKWEFVAEERALAARWITSQIGDLSLTLYGALKDENTP